MLPQSASNQTINNRNLDKALQQSDLDDRTLHGGGTQKTLTQNKRSVDGTPTLQGAMYLSQDRSSRELPTFEKMMDMELKQEQQHWQEVSEVPSFVRDLRTKYGQG
jgi:hypothetical protein